jgi:hypothetical protein
MRDLKFAVEAFAVSVFPGAARFDEERLRSDLSQPVSDDPGSHLRAIVGTDVGWDASSQHHVCKCLKNAEAAYAPCNPDSKAFPGVLINQRQQTDLPPIVRLS